MSTKPQAKPQPSKNVVPHKQPSAREAARAARTTVLHLCPDLEWSGPAREAVDLAVQTQRAGWRALIASSGGSLVTESERAAVRHTRMPLHSNGVFAGWRSRVQLEALLLRERPAILHAHGIDVTLKAYHLSRSHALPLVLDLKDPVPNKSSMRRLMKRIRQLGCPVRVPSHFMAEHLAKDFGLPQEQMCYVPPGVDLQFYNPVAVTPERLQGLNQLWRLPEQAAVVLMPMPLERGLGHEVFLKTLVQLKNENIFALMVGSDRLSPGMRVEIESLIHQYRLHGKVIMPDSCRDWPSAFWLAGVVVAANVLPRGQNLELLAAQAMGRPVIVSDSGANAEFVASGQTAWVVPANDVKALADAIREAIHLDTNQRLNLAEDTREFVIEHFPQATWFDSMMEIYEGLLKPAARTVKKTKAAA